MRFIRDDIFRSNDADWTKETWDIVVANPPYISPKAFFQDTARSVRQYEPRSALVPAPPISVSAAATIPIADSFYPRILHIAEQVRAKMLLVEVGDEKQACRVVDMILRGPQWAAHWAGCEIWRDWPSEEESVTMPTISGRNVRVLGQGEGRAVFAWQVGMLNI